MDGSYDAVQLALRFADTTVSAPDSAIVLEPRDAHGQPTGEQLLYLVRETKDTTDLDKLRSEEADKILCGQRHFRDALGVDYKVVTSAHVALVPTLPHPASGKGPGG